MAIREFMDLMEELKALHEKKNRDYSESPEAFDNFTRAATISSWFKEDIDKVFATLIGIKLARLAVLSNGREPNNESIDDTFRDLTCYAGLWTAYRRQKLSREEKVVKDFINLGAIKVPDNLHISQVLKDRIEKDIAKEAERGDKDRKEFGDYYLITRINGPEIYKMPKGRLIPDGFLCLAGKIYYDEDSYLHSEYWPIKVYDDSPL